MTTTIKHTLFAIIILVCFSCTEAPIVPECNDCPDPSGVSENNYLPLNEGSSWIYHTVSDWDNWVSESTDTIVVDSLYNIEDIDYSVLRGGYYHLQPVRKEGDTYFHRTLSCGFGPEEFLFKEIVVPQEEFTISTSPDFQYTITEKRLNSHIVNGMKFSDVIEVTHSYASAEIKLYYANHIGLIERNETSTYCTLHMVIKKYDIKK
jgi:hypothetical protein